ncbi:hypothetical protein [Romboutsia sp. 1001713B170207_170306_H8]|uniref:hypothetical protein n=1 Tax=Romboutsia sp. 1001713B170207_170306_H8 TaxID=2787112 RepID=UPI001899FEB0|nr:hypothetical protein [Romboutsia sp. 1001713B170207_170306_H8]
MARAKREINEIEVEEIIRLKLEELGGAKNKLTNNSVFQFNKKIANNPEYKRKDGQLFNLYGYDFWAGNYKGEDYYGKKKINEIKNETNIKVAGETFIPEVQDVILLVNQYHEKPEVLSRKLVSIFTADKKKLAKLEKENQKLKKDVSKYKKNLEDFQVGFASLFCNSHYSNNSLNDVISMKRSNDEFVYNELKDMYKDEDKILQLAKISNENEEANNKSINIVNESVLESRRNRARGLSRNPK